MAISGSGNRIVGCTFRDGILQPGRTGANDDVGALGICLNSGADNTEIAFSSFLRCKAPSPDYGEDGGALEVYGHVNGIRFHHNTVEDCRGVIEFGGGTILNVEITRNVLRNNGGLGGIHASGDFAASVSNITLEHNTIEDIRGGSEVFWVYGSTGQAQVAFRNNVVVYDGFQRFSSAAGVLLQNNVFFSPSGNPLGRPADPSDLVGVSPRFASAADLRLSVGSVAISHARTGPFSTDFEGRAISGLPDAGAYEFPSNSPQDITRPTAPAQLKASVVTSSGFRLSWSASSDDGQVLGYDVYRNGEVLATTTTTSVDIGALAANSTHTLTVRAKDAAGQASLPSAALTVSTLPPPNLLTNPGFESGTSGWSGSGARIASTSQRSEGALGLAVSSRTGPASGPQQDITAALRASGAGTYLAEAHVRMASGSALVRLTLRYTVAGVSSSVSTSAVSVGKSGFVRVSGLLALPLTAPLQQAVLSIETVAGRTSFQVDQCSLQLQAVQAGALRQAEVASAAEDSPPGSALTRMPPWPSLAAEPARGPLDPLTGVQLLHRGPTAWPAVGDGRDLLARRPGSASWPWGTTGQAAAVAALAGPTTSWLPVDDGAVAWFAARSFAVSAERPAAGTGANWLPF